MNKKLAEEAKNTIAKLNTTIHDFLAKLQEAEAKIVCQDDDIAAGRNNCYHIRPRPLFHELNAYAPYSKRTIAFDIVGYEDDCIRINFHGTTMTVPYEEPSTQEFKAICDRLFAQSIKDMERCRKVKHQAVQEHEERQKADTSTRAVHHKDGLTYRWIDCEYCDGRGTVQVGTGKWEDDPNSYADAPRSREITRTEHCPRCRGDKGLLVFFEEGEKERESPCTRYEFEQNEHNPLKLLMAGTTTRRE